tara:strand:+ start:13593 stop:14000 length:408 start_codon:yes stop_codon:yes gene_type:complete
MSTEKTVFTKLFKKTKQALKSQKVSLANIEDIVLRTDGASSDLDAYDDMLNDWVIRYIDLQNEVNGLVNMADIAANSMLDLDNVMSEFSTAAESLGINPFQFDEYASATLTLGSYENNIEDLNDTLGVAKTMQQL